jgi:hypothetical protein
MSEMEIILGLLQRLDLRVEEQTERTIARLTAIETRQEGMRVELVGVNLRLDIGNERMDVANGRVTKGEARLDAIEHREIREDGIADGKAEQRQAYRARLTRAWSLVWSPMGKGAGALALLLTGWTLHQVWPW